MLVCNSRTTPVTFLFNRIQITQSSFKVLVSVKKKWGKQIQDHLKFLESLRWLWILSDNLYRLWQWDQFHRETFFSQVASRREDLWWTVHSLCSQTRWCFSSIGHPSAADENWSRLRHHRTAASFLPFQRMSESKFNFQLLGETFA